MNAADFFISIGFVVFGQILNAFTVLIDKYVVTKTAVSRPGVYAFYVAIMSGIVIILLPFGVINIPNPETLAISILMGFCFILSIIFLYDALKHGNATDVVAWLAAISTLTTFVGSYFVLNEKLPTSFPLALIFFLLGMALVGHFRFYARSFLFVVLSGILFGISAVLVKFLFMHANFVNGFFWSRMGNVLAALSLLLLPGVRNHVYTTSKAVTHKTSSLIFINRILSGVSFICVLYAIRLGSPAIVNALSSLQFVFVFLLIFLFRKKLTEFYHHEFRKGHVLHKVLAITFIIIGFFTLFV